MATLAPIEEQVNPFEESYRNLRRFWEVWIEDNWLYGSYIHIREDDYDKSEPFLSITG
jgi:hypothetical protein